MAEFTPPMLALLSLYWLVHRSPKGRCTADALAANWAVCQSVTMIWQQAGFDGSPLLAFWVVDLITAAWLILCDGSFLARRAAKWILPMLALNSAIMALGTGPAWHYYALFALAFGQVLHVGMGLWWDGLLAIIDNTRNNIRGKLAYVAALFEEVRR